MTANHKYDFIIIGAGTAGLMTAAHIINKRVLILEKGNTPGKKLLISGSGRCNYTHEGDIKEFMLHYGLHGRFLKQALYQFDNKKTVQYFEAHGLGSVTDKNGKVFPETDRAEDVLDVLLSICRNNGVEFRFGSAVKSVATLEDEFVVETFDGRYSSHCLLIATGGRSYPKTGSTGDGYRFAKQLGHDVIPAKPALTSLLYSNFEFLDLSGVAIYNKPLSLYRNRKKLYDHRGDIGFTHKGLSGPGILDFSRYFEAEDVVKINLCNIPSDELRTLIIDEGKNSGKVQLKNFLKGFDIPESLVSRLLQKIGVDEKTTLATLEKEQRKLVVEWFTGFSFTIEQVGGFNQAMATAGGVSLEQVNPKTMESKLVNNLYFAGEVLDIDGDTGGYNIQAAFSMGITVAQSVNKR